MPVTTTYVPIATVTSKQLIQKKSIAVKNVNKVKNLPTMVTTRKIAATTLKTMTSVYHASKSPNNPNAPMKTKEGSMKVVDSKGNKYNLNM